MNSLFYLELLESKPRLLARMMAFNRQAAPCAPTDSKWMEAAWAHEDLREALQGRSGAAARESGFWDFAEESRRLAFLTPEALARLAALSGAALMGTRIAHTIDRAGVTALRETLGDELYRYGLMRGRFQAATLTNELDALMPPTSIEALLPSYASLVVAIVRSAWPPPLVKRTEELVREAGLSEVQFPAPPEAALCRRVWHFSKKIIFRELGGSWSEYFD